MSREVHVPFCEGLVVKVRRSTHLTFLRGPVRGMFFYLYLIVDLYNRKIVAWSVHDEESAQYASALACEASLYAVYQIPQRSLGWREYT